MIELFTAHFSFSLFVVVALCRLLQDFLEGSNSKFAILERRQRASILPLSITSSSSSSISITSITSSITSTTSATAITSATSMAAVAVFIDVGVSTVVYTSSSITTTSTTSSRPITTSIMSMITTTTTTSSSGQPTGTSLTSSQPGHSILEKINLRQEVTTLGDVHAFLKGHGADGRRLEGGHLADDDHQSGVPFRRLSGI